MASVVAGTYHRVVTQARSEDAALLALLRLRPGGASWAKIANQVQLDGTAEGVLAGVRDADQALIGNPGATCC